MGTSEGFSSTSDEENKTKFPKKENVQIKEEKGLRKIKTKGKRFATAKERKEHKKELIALWKFYDRQGLDDIEILQEYGKLNDVCFDVGLEVVDECRREKEEGEETKEGRKKKKSQNQQERNKRKVLNKKKKNKKHNGNAMKDAGSEEEGKEEETSSSSEDEDYSDT